MSFLADQPNIHPGCISSTGRNGRQSAIPTLTSANQGNITGLATAPLTGINLSNSNIGVSNILLPQTSTQNQAAQQLIGGAISPSLFVSTPLTSNNLGHHPVILNNIQTQMPIQPVRLSWEFKVEAILIVFVFCSNLDTICHCGSINECLISSYSHHMFLYVKSFFGSYCHTRD